MDDSCPVYLPTYLPTYLPMPTTYLPMPTTYLSTYLCLPKSTYIKRRNRETEILIKKRNGHVIRKVTKRQYKDKDKE